MYTSTCMCIELEVCHRNFPIGKQYFCFFKFNKRPHSEVCSAFITRKTARIVVNYIRTEVMCNVMITQTSPILKLIQSLRIYVEMIRVL